MKEWRHHKIGELGKVVTGKTPPSTHPELFLGKVPFITPGDMSDDARNISTERFVSTAWDPKGRLLLPAGSVCVVCIGMTIGKVCMTSRPSHTNQQINSVVVDIRHFDPRFVFYSMRTLAGEIRVRATGAQTRIVNKTVFSEIAISVPPLEIQRRIASILGAYDDLIEVNRRRITVLEEMARGLFAEWFTCFRFPGHENVPMLDTKDGPLPEGWSWVPFSELANFINGFAFKPSHFEDEGLPIVKIPELKNGLSAMTPRNSGKDVPMRLHIKDGDLLFSWSGTFAISEWTGGNALLNQHLFLVTPKHELGHGFTKNALIAALPKFDNQGVGATMKHIRRSALDQTVVAVPSTPSIIDRARRFFDAQYAQLVAIRRSNQSLSAARDLLLPRLISGQLSVAEAERELEEAA